MNFQTFRPLFLAMSLIAAATSVSGASTVVLNTNNSGAGSLRQVILDAPTNATITFASNLSGQTIMVINSEIVLSKNVTIDGSSLATAVQLNGGHINRIFRVESGVTVTNNSLIITNGAAAGNAGGGIIHYGQSLVLKNCIIAGCSAGFYGGGIYSSGMLTVNNSTFANNTALNLGGGICHSLVNARLTVNNSTFANNAAKTGGGSGTAGGIYNIGVLTINNSTIVSNTAGFIGGGIQNDGTLNLTNCIVSANVRGDIEGGYSGSSSNLVGVANINLAPLGNYGGPTPIMPPLPGSPAIDAGTDSIINFLPTDQRGFPRKLGGHVDIGAVEGVYVVNYAGPGELKNAMRLGNGAFQFEFTNHTDMSLTVWASTNVALPLNLWSNLGSPVESPAGAFTFTDSQATNSPQRFYRVSSP